MTIAGRTGLHIQSVKSRASIESTLHHGSRGTLSFWFSPLEDIDKSPAAGSDPTAMCFPLVSDCDPPRENSKMRFGVYWNGAHYPRLIGRFKSGVYWEVMDNQVGPMVYADHLPLRKGQWYHVVLTWDKPGTTLLLYVNGRMVGHNYLGSGFEDPGTVLHLGNPLMVISDLALSSSVMNDGAVADAYRGNRPVSNEVADGDVAQVAGPMDLPPLDVGRDRTWKETYRCDFTRPADLDGWHLQTGDQYRDQFELRTTEDGLYWRTPDIVARESRGYLWCPSWFEGDQWIEFDFRLESPKGLALLIICASGMQREDIVVDHGLPDVGAMGPMLSQYRNYHWEYVRRVEAMRTDVETQYIHKNPWGKSMHMGCFPRLKQNSWHRLRWLKMGPRLHGSIDGKTVFDVTDTAFDNNGPVLNAGRIVLRQMYHTTMRYRDFVVYQRA